MWLLMLVVQEPLADGGVGARGVASLLELFEWYVVGGSAVIAIKVKVARCLNHVDMQE